MSVTALVPVKGAALAKGRLAGVLAPEERRALVADMLRHVLHVLAASATVDQVRLVGPEPWLATNDASWFIDGGIGLNEALAEAHAGLPVEPSDIRLIVAADLPLLEASDIEALIEAARTGALAVAPDRAGSGTNALAFPATLDLHFRFGPDSRTAHEAEARRLGIAAVAIDRPGLAFDLDDGAALAQFRSSGSGQNLRQPLR